MAREPRRIAAAAVFTPWYLANDLRRRAVSKLRHALLGQRDRAIRCVSEEYGALPRDRAVLAVMTHVVTPEDMADPARRAAKRECLSAALDALLSSFSHHRLEIVVNTYRGMSLFDELPEHHRQRCRLHVHQKGDPMFIEFFAQEIFLEAKDRFDYFLFLEDDILLGDACFLEKVEEFNRRSPYADALLLPHRFELNEGVKYYDCRDFRNKMWTGPAGSDIRDVVNALTLITYESELLRRKVRFAEYTNPHAAVHCLDRRQLGRWEATGRHWRGKVSWIGPLESAATGCLFEGFHLYKPHPENRWFLEVRHLGTKYSDRIRREQAGEG